MSTPHEQQATEREQLLKERLSEEELRTLLKRLQAHDAAASEMPTVGAVVEATGADPGLIGGLLADIRRETARQVTQAAQTIQVVHVRGTTHPARIVVALIAGLIAALFVLGLFSVRSATVESTGPTIERVRAAPRTTTDAPAKDAH